MEFIYCGKVDVEDKDVLRFQKILKNLRIESTRVEEDFSYLNPEIKIKEEKIDDVSEIDYGMEKVEDYDMDYESLMEDDETKSGDGEYSPMTTANQRIAKIRQNLSKTLAAGTQSSFFSKTSKQRTQSPFFSKTPKTRTRVEMVVKDDDNKAFMDLHPLICPFCRKKAKTMKHRNEHVKYCSENPDRVVSKCPYCEKSFCDPYYVRKHIKTLHADITHGFENTFHL